MSTDPTTKSESCGHPTTTTTTTKTTLKSESCTTAMKAQMLMPQPQNTVLLVCDLQDRFRKLIPKMERMIISTRLLLSVCQKLQIPIIMTEQYPKVFGSTVEELKLSNVTPVAKTKFSMLCTEVTKQLNDLKSTNPFIKNVILVGLEAHICLLQTALELLQLGYNVHVPFDCVGSQRLDDEALALRRLESAGASISSAESVVFQLLVDAKHSNFKEVQELIKLHISQLQQLKETNSHYSAL